MPKRTTETIHLRVPPEIKNQIREIAYDARDPALFTLNAVAEAALVVGLAVLKDRLPKPGTPKT